MFKGSSEFVEGDARPIRQEKGQRNQYDIGQAKQQADFTVVSSKHFALSE